MADSTDNMAFADMEYAAADKTAVDLFGSKSKVTKEDVHNMLMAAGFTPGLGNIADAADALLYTAEGEFGSAALSLAAIIPFIGQAVSAKRALKVTKESGEKMVTLYRGVNKGFQETMIAKGRIVGNPKSKGYKAFGVKETLPNTTLFTSTSKKTANAYTVPHHLRGTEFEEIYRKKRLGEILEFEVPQSFVDKNAFKTADEVIFKEGIPSKFLTKVHK